MVGNNLELKDGGMAIRRSRLHCPSVQVPESCSTLRPSDQVIQTATRLKGASPLARSGRFGRFPFGGFASTGRLERRG